jgi:hypothetical protein
MASQTKLVRQGVVMSFTVLSRALKLSLDYTISSRFIITSALLSLQLKHNEYIAQKKKNKKQSANAPGSRFNCSQRNEYNSRERVQTAGTDLKLEQTKENDKQGETRGIVSYERGANWNRTPCLFIQQPNYNRRIFSSQSSSAQKATTGKCSYTLVYFP